MSIKIFATQPEALAVKRKADIAGGYETPRKGVHGGGGVHVPMPDVYTPGAPGWTHSAVTVRPSKDGTQWAVCDAETVAGVPELAAPVDAPKGFFEEAQSEKAVAVGEEAVPK